MTAHLRQLVEDPKASWRENAACRAHPHPEWWLDERHVTQAEPICAECPVRVQCRADVERWERTEQRTATGVYAGLTAAQRGKGRGVFRGPQAARMEAGATCEVCGDHFVDKGRGTIPRFCSTPCRERARYRRRRGWPEDDAFHRGAA